MKRSFHSYGKLLLSGEYVVLDGALALSIPTKLGQQLHVQQSEKAALTWQSKNAQGAIWYEETFELQDDQLSSTDPESSNKLLLELLKTALKLNPDFKESLQHCHCESVLEFEQHWGLGSSSTLINNIAHWAEVDAFELSDKTLGGSGYDIAAAQHPSPLLYQLNGSDRYITPLSINWEFTEQLYFVHLNQKQDSRAGIKHYRAIEDPMIKQGAIQEISGLTEAMLKASSLKELEDLMDAHEGIISDLLSIPTVKKRLFNDYPNSIKSLGAWGGDFMMVSGTESDMTYFKEKGYHTIISFDDMIA